MNRACLIAATLLIAAVSARADILIGTAGPMQGQYAGFGEQLRRGAQMAVDDINATGGLRGERLVLEADDDGCDPRKAVVVASGFVSKGVKFVAGHFCSGSSIPAAKVYEAAGIVMISPASTNPKFTDEGGWNTHRIIPRDDAQAAFAGTFIATAYRDRPIAVLSDQSLYGASLAAALRKTLEAAGFDGTLFETYRPGAKDFSALIAKLRDAGIDAVYLAGYYPEAALILRQMREAGIGAQMIGPDSLVAEDFWKIAGKAAEGTLMTFAADPQKFDGSRALLDRFKEDNYNPEGATLYAYAAVQAWVQAAEATVSTDGHRIADWLRGGNRLRTVVGEVSFDAKGDVVIPHFTWLRWSEGKYAEDETLNSPSLTGPGR